MGETDREETIWTNFESTRENFKMDITREVRKVVDNNHLVQDEVLVRGSC